MTGGRIDVSPESIWIYLAREVPGCKHTSKKVTRQQHAINFILHNPQNTSKTENSTIFHIQLLIVTTEESTTKETTLITGILLETTASDTVSAPQGNLQKLTGL